MTDVVQKDGGNPKRGFIVEPQILTSGLSAAPHIRDLFSKHHLEWTTVEPGKYSPNMVREFYASYAASVHRAMPPKAKEIDQPPLQSTLVREVPVYVLEETIR